MDTLDRFLIREFLGFFVVIALGVALLFLGIDFMSNLWRLNMPTERVVELYLYKVPAGIAGRWTAKVPAAVSKDPIGLSLLTQQITRVSGRARVGGRDVIVEEGEMHGEVVKFRLLAGSRSYDFTGTVRGDAIEGTLTGGELKSASWSAARGK